VGENVKILVYTLFSVLCLTLFFEKTIKDFMLFIFLLFCRIHNNVKDLNMKINIQRKTSLLHYFILTWDTKSLTLSMVAFFMEMTFNANV
jgi:hypothetical protein